MCGRTWQRVEWPDAAFNWRERQLASISSCVLVLVSGKMMTVHDNATAAELIAEGEAVPVAGWDFSWFDGRATEERPAWGYARLMAGRIARARAGLDVQTGGGEVLAGIASSLRPGGSFLSQQVGAGSNRELYEFMMGPQPASESRSAAVAAAEATAAGLQVTDLREQALQVEFFDVAAVVHFLLKVLWTVPGFTVDGYLSRLEAMHEHIRANGSFICHSQRFLIEARKPA
jgi:hypothetical protein